MRQRGSNGGLAKSSGGNSSQVQLTEYMYLAIDFNPQVVTSSLSSLRALIFGNMGKCVSHLMCPTPTRSARAPPEIIREDVKANQIDFNIETTNKNYSNTIK